MSLVQRAVQTDDIAKINFTFTDLTTQRPAYSPGRCSYIWPFDFAAYDATEIDREKQSHLLAAFHTSLKWVAEREGWDCTPLDDAHTEILKRDFQFSGTSKASWLSPNGKYRARVAFDWRLSGIHLFALLYRNRSSKELSRQYLAQAVPMAGILHEYLNAGRWQSDTHFQVAIGLPFRKTWSVDFCHAMPDSAT